MSGRGLIVCVPALPMDVFGLMPRRGAAVLAAALTDAGHEVRIADFGTLDDYRAFATPGLRAAGRDLCDDFTARPLESRKCQCYERLFGEAVQRWRWHVSFELLKHPGVDFAVFWIETRAEAAEAIQVGALLKNNLPGLPLALAGPYAAVGGAAMVSQCGVFSVACHAAPERTVPKWVEALDRPEEWSRFEGLWARRGGGIEGGSAHTVPDDGVLPVYTETVYPAMRKNLKLKLYSIVRGGELRYLGHGACMRAPRDARTPGGALRRELQRLRLQQGARAFSISGAGLSWNDTLITLRARGDGGPAVFSMEGPALGLDVATACSLYEQGCRAVDFRIPTGSQRLLEDFHGYPGGIGAAESCLHAARAAGMFVSVSLVYPCPKDDYHTAAETVRLLYRGAPHGVRMALPFIEPGSLWRQNPGQFGFRFSAAQYARWLSAVDYAPRWLDAPRPEKGMGMPAWNAPRIAAMRGEMLAQLTEFGVTPDLHACHGVLAHAAGEGDRVTGYARSWEEALFRFDVDAVARLIEQFNAGAVSSERRYTLVPFDSALAAVAN